MQTASKQLPDDPQELKNLLLLERELSAQKDAQIDHLSQQYQQILEQFRLAQQRQFGQSSDVSLDQLGLFNETEQIVEEDDLEVEQETISYTRRKPKRKPLPKDLPRETIVHDIWGLTVFSTDGEDLYVYETNPANPNQYRYQGQWENMRIITETINVKGAQPVTVQLKYTRHGPVSFEDNDRNLAYAVRPAWMEVGGAPYLASLRMDQSENWEQFREATNYSNIPGENMIWADRDGDIGWQAVGIAPIRRNLIDVAIDGGRTRALLRANFPSH